MTFAMNSSEDNHQNLARRARIVLNEMSHQRVKKKLSRLFFSKSLHHQINYSLKSLDSSTVIDNHITTPRKSPSPIIKKNKPLSKARVDLTSSSPFLVDLLFCLLSGWFDA